MVKTRSQSDRDSAESLDFHSSGSDPSSKEIDTSESEGSDYFDEEFEIDERILEDPILASKVDKIIEYIGKQTPSMKDILEAPMRLKNKAKIFELVMIYEQTLPMTEERMILRNQLYRLFIVYKQDYCQFKKNKETIMELEKDSKNYSEYSKLQASILSLNTSIENKKILYRKFMELRESTEPDGKLKIWIKEALKLPYDNIKMLPRENQEMKDMIQNVARVLNQTLFGMDNVKEQLLLFLHSKMMNPEIKGSCLGLIGPPGVGKTSIAKCIAQAIDLPFEQISFGGAHNSDFIKGHDYTYVGSKSGEIVRCLSRMKYKNGILFFDEYEKISQNQDIMACLLHITDFSQNSEFRDNYLCDIPIDLSSIWFIYSMNELPQDGALKDRIYPIFVEGYTHKEKIKIIREYLFPKHLKNINMGIGDIVISEDVASHLVSKTSENNKGVREIEQQVKSVIQKVSFLVNHNDMKTSFAVKTKLTIPVELTRDMIDSLTKTNCSTSPCASFYI